MYESLPSTLEAKRMYVRISTRAAVGLLETVFSECWMREGKNEVNPFNLINTYLETLI